MDEWIKHDGKGMPVPPETLVICRFHDGDEEISGMAIRASYWDDDLPEQSNWVFQGDGADITHYRIITPKQD